MTNTKGYRRGTRYMFSRPFKKHGVIPLSTYMVNYKRGDIVDVKVMICKIVYTCTKLVQTCDHHRICMVRINMGLFKSGKNLLLIFCAIHFLTSISPAFTEMVKLIKHANSESWFLFMVTKLWNLIGHKKGFSGLKRVSWVIDSCSSGEKYKLIKH